MKEILRVTALCLALWPAGLLGACSDAGLPADDIAAARTALVRHDWLLAERLLERYLREARDVDARWEAWNYLLTALNADGQETRAELDVLETMLAEFADDDARSAEVLHRMGECAERLRRYERAAEAWNMYVGLHGLSAQHQVEGYRRLAAMQLRLRRFDAGESSLRQCLALPLVARDKILCMYDLADQSMARERWQDVLDLCGHIFESQPEESLRGMTGYLLADALEQLGRNEEALKAFEQARGAYPNPSVIDNRIAKLRKKTK